MQTLSAIDLSAWPHQQAADTVIGLMQSLARRRGLAPSTLAGQTLGLVGFDETARAVAKRASQNVGMQVLVYGESDEERTIARKLGLRVSPSLSHLLGRSGVVSLHRRPGDGAAIIDALRLNQMKPDAFLINADHGALIDQQDLLHALWFETIGGAGIAVPEDTLDRLSDLEACDNALVVPSADRRREAAPGPTKPEAFGNVVPLFPAGQLPG
ncbi:MAG: NAD(P)-dependent oxidoreductase [Pseudomonadota bacterium]